MPTSVNKRVQKRRDSLRAAGLRPVQIWIPDSRRPGFADACRRQTLVAAQADASDVSLQAFLDGALSDMTGQDE